MHPLALISVLMRFKGLGCICLWCNLKEIMPKFWLLFFNVLTCYLFHLRCVWCSFLNSVYGTNQTQPNTPYLLLLCTWDLLWVCFFKIIWVHSGFTLDLLIGVYFLVYLEIAFEGNCMHWSVKQTRL